LAVFREICAVGSTTVFDVKGLTVHGIREELDYGGLCIKSNATIGGARVRIAIDIGFGDTIEPDLTALDLPVRLSDLAAFLMPHAAAARTQPNAIGSSNPRNLSFHCHRAALKPMGEEEASRGQPDRGQSRKLG